MKRLLLGSMIAASLILATGCGSDDNDNDNGDGADTTKPVVNTPDFSMDTNGTYRITANETSTFALIGEDHNFTLTAAGILTAPAVENTYTLAVQATDEANNTSATKSINVTVSDASSGGSQVPTKVTADGKEWSALIPYDENATISGRQTYAVALAECQGQGMDLASLTDLEDTVTENNNSSSSLKGQDLFKFTEAIDSNLRGDGTVIGALTMWTKDADTTADGFGMYANNDTGGNAGSQVDDGKTDVNVSASYFYTCTKEQ